MTIDSFIPTLKPMVEQINVELRFVCYFILTTSIIIRVSHARHGSASTLLRPIVTATVITGLIATLPFWFNLIREEFWEIAMTIRSQYAGDLLSTGSELLKRLKPAEDGINWLDVTHSLMKAVQYAIGWIIVFLGSIIQLPMLFVQYVMECLCYLFLPIALSLFALDSTRSLAIRYLQQTLAVLAWSIGFAVVDLVGYSLLTSVPSLPDAVASNGDVQFTPNNFMLCGVVAIWLILGSLGTPIIMQLLFCSGSPLSSSVGQSIQMGLAALGMAHFAAGGAGSGASSVSPASGGSAGSAGGASSGGTPPSSGGGGSGSGGESTPQLPPSSSLVVATDRSQGHSTASASTHQASASAQPPRGHTQPPPEPPTFDLSLDPTGDHYAVNLMNLNQVPQSISY